MKKSHILMVVLVILLTFSLGVGRSTAQETRPGATLQAALGTGFTYQGQLKTSGGSPVTATCDFQFTLWDALSGPTQVGTASTVTGIAVVNGSFTAQVNTGGEFGSSAFSGAARWLEIGVKCGSEAAYTTLGPRQPLTPAPYALALPGLYTQQGVNSPNVIGGYSGNTVTIGLSGATISGGGTSGNINSVTGNFGTVSGGYHNTASVMYATVGGGYGNNASNSDATVGGGENNTASGDTASVGGGIGNTASGAQASVDGGYSNTASGDYSTVSGGVLNMAFGDYSFAAGRQAKANYTGTFVWADSNNNGGTGADFASTGIDQFLIRANGGVGINTNAPANASLQVARDLSVSGGYGQIEAIGATNNLKRLTLGFDTTNNIGWIQASITGTGYNNLALNPSGANVLIGTTTNTGDRLRVNGTIRVDVLGGAGSTNLCLNGSNQIAICSSSLRYKNNVAGLSLGLNTIASLRPVTFDWKGTGEHDLGFVAEEVDKVTPLLTTRNAAGEIEGVKYDRISAVLVNAVQEQQKQIADLQAQVATLKQGTVPNNTAASPLSTPWPWLALVTIILGGMVITRRQGVRS